MRILIANLKHFYQRRHLWFAYALIAFVLVIGTMDDDGRPVFPSAWYLPLFIGIVVVGTNLEMSGKPFVLCLPGHLRVVRVVVFLVGLVVSVPAGALFMRYSRVDVPRSPAVFCAAVCASMVIYLAVAGRSRFLALFSLAPLLFLIPRLQSAFEAVVVQYPLWLIAGGISISLIVWLQMARWKWGRVHPRCNLYPGRQQALYALLERRYTREAGASAAMAGFFVRRMEHAPDYRTSRYVWGSLYAKWGNLAIWWKGLVLAFIGISVVVLYTGWLGAIVAFFWVSWVAVPQSWPPLHSVQLVPAGRRQRFAAVVSLAAVVAAILAVWIAVVSMLSVPLSILIPEVEIWDIPFACKRLPLGIVSVPLIVVPFLATLSVLVPRRLHIVVPIVVLLSIKMAMVFMLWLEFHGLKPLGGPVSWLAGAIFFAWTLFLAACRYRTRYGPLTSQ